MIQIYVDEGAAFDMLAILHLKKDKANGFANYEDFLDDLYDVLGVVQVDEILKSKEYVELLDANQRVFNLIDIVANGQDTKEGCGHGGFTALYIHNANMKRFYAKKALQARFFSEDLTEQKTIK